MKRYLPIALIALLVLGLIPGSAGAVEAARTIEVDDQETTSAEWTSDVFVGAAPDFFLGGTAGPDYECGAVMPGNCEYSLIGITGITQAEIDQAVADGKDLRTVRDTVNLTVGITNYAVPVSDLDIIVWASNAEGEKLSEMGRVGDLDTDPSEEFNGAVVTTAATPVQYVLLEVVYFAGAGTYDGYVDVS